MGGNCNKNEFLLRGPSKRSKRNMTKKRSLITGRKPTKLVRITLMPTLKLTYSSFEVNVTVRQKSFIIKI